LSIYFHICFYKPIWEPVYDKKNVIKSNGATKEEGVQLIQLT